MSLAQICGQRATLGTLRPCPLCGEQELFSVNDQFAEMLVHRPDGSVARDARGDEVVEEVDYVECHMCGSMLPLKVWKGELPSPAEREAYREYCAAVRDGAEQ